MREPIRWGYVKEWLKGSLANIYTVIGNQIANLIFLLLFSLGGEGSRGIYGAAAIVVNVITYSSFLAFALYPKLLTEAEKRRRNHRAEDGVDVRHPDDCRRHGFG